MSDRGGGRVVVGRVGRPHGLDGSFVVEGASERLAVGQRVWVGDERAEILSLKRVGGGRVAARLDRPIERGTPLELDRGELPEPDEGSYYVVDLVGLEVVEEDGRRLGRVRDVVAYPANDVLELDSGILLPLHEDCVRDVDLAAGRILVAPGFAEPL